MNCPAANPPPGPDEPGELLCASWVAGMRGEPCRDAAVLVRRNRVGAVGSIGNLRVQFPQAHVVDLPGLILLPGLVNAHTHLELSDCRPPAISGGFVPWIKSLMSQTRVDEGQLPKIVGSAIDEGIRQCLAFGVTAVGDISRQCHLTRRLLRDAALRVVSYGEVQAMAQRRDLLETRLALAAGEQDASPRLSIGLSPHAPYSIEPAGYRRCLQVARERHLPLATHLAETPDEAEFLRGHAGSFRELWTWLDGWDEQVPRFAGSPVQFAASMGLLDYPTLLAHVNYCGDDDLELLRAGRASVVYCPRTHAYFQHPPHRWRDMLAAGINVAVGTDSCASSPNLNLVEELRLLHQIAPEVPAATLWELATTRAAGAISAADVGSLAPGNTADIVAFEASGPDPLVSILERDELPRHTWFDGVARSL